MTARLLRAFAFIGVGLGLGSWGGSHAWRAQRSKTWPNTSGTIIESRGGTSSKPALDDIHLSYSYAVQGQLFTSHRWRIGHNGLDGTRLAARYAVGQSVTVYYEPGNPQSAVLDTGLDATPFMMMGVALSLVALGVVTLRHARHNK